MPIVSTKKLLSQKRPATVSANPLYKPPTNGKCEVTSILVCNTTAVAATFNLYHDKDGANFSTDTLIYSAISVAANSTNYIEFSSGLFIQDATGQLGCLSSTSGSLNFTVYGIETIET